MHGREEIAIGIQRINGAPLDPARRYTVAMPDYVFKGGDDYSMFAGGRVLISPEDGDLVLAVLETYVRANANLSPALDGRITILR